jgi:carbon-monoxide dehydrogenase small subunit
MTKVAIEFTLNDQEQNEFVECGSTLLSVLRGKLGLYSTKAGCHQGTCGACTVIIDGSLRLSCTGKAVTTLEGLSRDGTLHPLQQAFMEGFAAQCGFCTPGMILAAKTLLDHNPRPSRAEVVDAISGNICRCTGYEPIIDAVLTAAEQMRGKKKSA